MKKVIVTSMVLIFSLITVAQEKYFTKYGKLSLYSSTPFENIEAVNRSTVSVFDKNSGQIEVSTLVKGFEFQKALMQEHFNENYMESDKFPKASFKGTIDLSKVDFTKDGKYGTTASGQLMLHGETKSISAPVTFDLKNGVVSATTEFTVTPSDFKITIPSLVKDKIAKEIKINMVANFEPLKK